MKIITEIFESAKILTEELDGKKSMYISGPFLMFGKQNRNGRIYPEEVMDKAVKDYQKNYIDKKRSLGEMNHPAGRLSIDPERACIMTTELKKDGNFYHGKAKVLSTPLGKVLEALLNDGVVVGVSSRGVGSVTQTGKTSHVKNDFGLTTSADVVHDPSVGDAFVQHLMEEREYLFIDGQYIERDMFEAKARIFKAPMATLEEAKLAEFVRFIDKLRTPK